AEAVRGVAVVVDDEHAQRPMSNAPVHLRRDVDGRNRQRLVRDQRQPHRKDAPLPLPRALRGDRAAVQLDQALDDREAEPETALGPIALARALDERIEDLPEQILRHADAVVPEPDLDVRADAAGLDTYGTTRGGVLGRVHEQVRE